MPAIEPSPINITIGPERHTVQVHRGSGPSVGTYSFRGLDNDEYRWQPSSQLLGNKIEVCTWMGRSGEDD